MMQSAHCQTMVRNSITKYEVVEIIKQSAGEIQLEMPYDFPVTELIEIIEGAGYGVEEIDIQDKEPSKINTFNYNTNINCSGCVAKISPHLKALNGIHHWEVDTANPDKPLKVIAEGVSSAEILNTVQKAGFKISINNDQP